MNLDEVQIFCKELLSKVNYPRVGTVIGLQEEMGKLCGAIMDLEIYEKPVDRKKLERQFSEFFFSYVDLCNAYEVSLSETSNSRVKEMRKKIELWERENSEVLSSKRRKMD